MEVKIDCRGNPYFIEVQGIKYKKPSFHRNTLELIFVLKGELTVETDEVTDVIKAGEFVAINAGINHTLHGGKDTYITCLYLDLNHYEQYYPYIHGISFYCKYIEEEWGEDELYLAIRNYFIRIIIIMNTNLENGHGMVSRICDIMIDILINHVVDLEYIKNKVSHLKDIDKERMFRMTQFMSENWNKGLTLADLAKHENLSPTRLSHFWKSITNITFMDTINFYRYNEAKRLLMNGVMSISEISETCGFSDEKYLYKTFKEKHNMTPKEYKDHHKKLLMKPDEYAPQDITEVTELLVDYGEKYFRDIEDFSFLTRFPELIEEEKSLNGIYSFIAGISDKYNRGRKVADNAIVISLGLNRGIKMDENNNVVISWEYMYSTALVTVDLFKNCGISVAVEFLGVEGWLDVFHQVTEKIKEKWGRDFISKSDLVVTHESSDTYEDALELAKKAVSNRYFEKAETVLNI